MTRQPAIFVSHGSPMILLEPSPARDFLAGLAGTLAARPRAILSVTAHWMTGAPAVSLDGDPETIHDFGGFAPALYQMTYPAPGAPEVGEAAVRALRAAGHGVEAVARRGFDHGTWVPLKLAFPQADVPVAQMSVQPARSPRQHYELGQALAGLREEGVLILASGAATHNLRAFFGGGFDSPPAWVGDFTAWLQSAIAENRIDDLLDFEARAPHAQDNHPTSEHILPLFVALGAATAGCSGRLLHHSIDAGVLAMDAYGFD